jgi:hypothetical protein
VCDACECVCAFQLVVETREVNERNLASRTALGVRA